MSKHHHHDNQHDHSNCEHKHSHDHHGHSHSHLHGHAHDVENIKMAFFLNFGFAIIEIIGGFFTNSMAILSDSVHDLGDSLSLGMAWYFQNFSKKKSNKKYTYGYKRFSLVGAMVNAIVLTVGSVMILLETIPRLFNPEHADPKGMIFLAILGIIINGMAVLRLKKGTNLNERVVSLHLLEDVLGWVAVLIGAIIMLFADLPIIDPILSLLIAGFILFNIFKNLKELFRIILQGSPLNIDIDKAIDKIKELDEVANIHDLHSWSVDGEYNVTTLHVVLRNNNALSDNAEIKQNIRNILKEENIQHTTIELEYEKEECEMKNCTA